MTSASAGACNNLGQWGSYDVATHSLVWNVPETQPTKWMYLNGSFFSGTNDYTTLNLPVNVVDSCSGQFLTQDWLYYSPLITKNGFVQVGFNIKSLTLAISVRNLEYTPFRSGNGRKSCKNRSGYQLKLSLFLSTGWGPLHKEYGHR